MSFPTLPFAFGVEQSYQFSGVSGQQPPETAAQEEAVRPWRSKVIALEAEVQTAKAQVDGLQTKARMGNALVASLQKEARDRGAELTVRTAVCDQASTMLEQAQRAESIAREVARSLRDKNQELENRQAAMAQKHVDEKHADEEFYHGRIAELTKTVDEQRRELAREREQHVELQGQYSNLSADSLKQAQQLHLKDGQLDKLRTHIDKLHDDVSTERDVARQNESLLSKAYAELEQTKAARNTVVVARDEALAAEHGRRLEIADLIAEMQELNQDNAQLRQDMEAIDEVEKQNAGLQQDLEDLRDQMHGHDRTVLVKDERISHLEKQLQKERQRTLAADDAAAAAAAAAKAVMSPVNEPLPVYTSTVGDSLEDELAASSDYDADSVYDAIESLDFSLIRYVDVQPVEPPTLEFGIHVEEAASVVPVARRITITTESVDTGSQTDTPPAPVASAPHLTASIISAATITIAPVEAQEPVVTEFERKPTATIAVQTNFTNPMVHDVPIDIMDEEPPLEAPTKRPTSSSGTQTDKSQPAPPTTTAITTKSSVSSSRGFSRWLLPIAAIILSIFCLRLYTEVQRWRTANGIGYGYDDAYSRGGAYGNGRKIFGLFDVAMHIGNSDFSESIARAMSVVITRYEDWAGIDHVPHY
ncbi:hypothetical protein P153DRAFT_392100 [Dothidotthia symphoricarpi CBS 119687]|uniref:Uncharacterized protein n=1 Tax=Dothidotthia symphoricarpi CBS 119687 TaxID=1392245 RepID=A0A6A6AUZ3_9PLEO|nr:uncharacterized protein P153DRAFT_392100 [Dothidotthia symphoricarpi CBS 119687]KAF2134785.1 hypothetical protein P153DRAFT_392100 [Dothidotthia symphoricarpi CBS 119687]